MSRHEAMTSYAILVNAIPGRTKHLATVCRRIEKHELLGKKATKGVSLRKETIGHGMQTCKMQVEPANTAIDPS